jgi:glycosyltransferase involved in cell wall biosynthesis
MQKRRNVPPTFFWLCKMKILVIIPCYNEEKNIDRVVQNIQNYKLPNDLSNCIIDYLIVNDCSDNTTLEICKRKNYNYINLPVNLGIGGGVQAGYLYAYERGYDIVIQHDGDGQHDPCYFGDVISPILAGQADIVIGSRFLAKEGFQSSGLRRFGIAFLGKMIFLCTGIKVHDVTSGYRAVNRKYIKLFADHYAQDYPEPEAIMDAALYKAKILEVAVIMREREEGKSSISPIKSIYYMIKVSLAILFHRLVASK